MQGWIDHRLITFSQDVTRFDDFQVFTWSITCVAIAARSTASADLQDCRTVYGPLWMNTKPKWFNQLLDISYAEDIQDRVRHQSMCHTRTLRETYSSECSSLFFSPYLILSWVPHGLQYLSWLVYTCASIKFLSFLVAVGFPGNERIAEFDDERIRWSEREAGWIDEQGPITATRPSRKVGWHQQYLYPLQKSCDQFCFGARGKLGSFGLRNLWSTANAQNLSQTSCSNITDMIV